MRHTKRWGHGLRQGRRECQSGISLIETLIAMLLLTFIAIGLLPLMTRSIQQNTQAGSFTTSSNWNRSTLEEFNQLGFLSPRLAIPGGSTQSTIVEFWHPVTSSWQAAPPVPAVPGSPTDLESNPWRRSIVIEQFNIGDLEDNGVLDTPLDGGSPIAFVQIKRIQVTIDRVTPGFIARTPPVALEIIKAV